MSAYLWPRAARLLACALAALALCACKSTPPAPFDPGGPFPEVPPLVLAHYYPWYGTP